MERRLLKQELHVLPQTRDPDEDSVCICIRSLKPRDTSCMRATLTLLCTVLCIKVKDQLMAMSRLLVARWGCDSTNCNGRSESLSS